MTILISPDSGKLWLLIGLTSFSVFSIVWVTTNCIYSPEDLGGLRGICGKNYSEEMQVPRDKRSIPSTQIRDQITTNVTHTRHKRGTQLYNEGSKTDSLTDNMLLLKFKYAYARKTGYEKCWICSKLHPSTARIPLMAMPLNFYPLLNGTPPIILTNVTRTLPNNTLTFPIIGRSHSPDWCFRLGNSTKRAEVCQHAKINFSMTSIEDPVFHTSDPTMNATLMDFLSSSSTSPVGQLLSSFTFSSLSDEVMTIFNKRPLALGNSIYICCGKICHPWIPTEPQGWCYLASLVPIMGVVGDDKGEHLLEASMHPRYPLKHRHKRELFFEKDMAWAWFPSWTGWGIDIMKRLNNYSKILDEILDKNSGDITNLNEEMRAIKKQLELHDLAIESMSAALTGLCEVTEDYRCCTWIHNTSVEIPDYYDIIAQHQKEVDSLQQEARDIAKTWSPFGKGNFGLGGIFSWLKDIAMTIIIILLFLLFLYACFKLIMCIIARASKSPTHDTSMVSNQVPDYDTPKPHAPGDYSTYVKMHKQKKKNLII
ncbi:uncharacterized protein LOC120945560 [Rana temporaria]|uniref:uncharacterized protein LOC120945560 n=1 Tax=Rana temporaria TaxID=8407 RepID=UPI001AACF8DF|nr:uncharacterized protein LOC120945560 [Rana temporaria]